MLTAFAPLIALILAAILLIGQDDPEKRRSLRGWAVASGVWLALWPFAVMLILIQLTG